MSRFPIAALKMSLFPMALAGAGAIHKYNNACHNAGKYETNANKCEFPSNNAWNKVENADEKQNAFQLQKIPPNLPRNYPGYIWVKVENPNMYNKKAPPCKWFLPPTEPGYEWVVVERGRWIQIKDPNNFDSLSWYDWWNSVFIDEFIENE
jgi:hypothetical protein